MMAAFAHAGDFAGAAAIRWGGRELMAGTLNRQAAVCRSLPAAVDPLALSLNENPFPPLPAVRSALIASIGVGQPLPGVPAASGCAA